MKKTLITACVLCLFAAFFMMLPSPPSAAKQANITIISDAKVFDGERWLGIRDVAFKKSMILEVAENLKQKYVDANIVDGSNQYLIPGLIDAHTHAWDDALTQAVKFGVTTELDMFTNNIFASVQREMREQHDSDIGQADLFSAGTLVTAPKGHGTEYGFKIATIDDYTKADTFVVDRINEGSDYIKIVYDASNRHMPSIDKKTLTAVIKASHQQGKLAVVHISDYQSAFDAINAGADGLVHGFMTKIDVEALATTMAENKQFMIPTLSILASMMGQDRSKQLINDFSAGSRFNIDASKFNVKELVPQLTGLRGKHNRAGVFKQAQVNMAALAKAGVMILAGTDAPNPGTAHGISLHGELELLVECGLSENQALMAATSNVAKAFKLAQRGYIKRDMKADMVLLSKDPQLDISHTRAIVKVFKNGYEINANKQKFSDKLTNSVKLGDFDKDLVSAFKTTWQPTSDQRFGGNSQISIKGEHKDKRQYLAMKGEVNATFSYPWAGAFSSFSLDNKKAVNLEEIKTISFDAKGSEGKYKLMIFSTKQLMRPIEVEFDVNEQWQKKTLSISQISPVLLSSVTGIAIVAATPNSHFELMIDDVWLNH